MIRAWRKFEVAKGFEGQGINLPERSTELSAGYDFECAERTEIQPGSVAVIPTGVKAYMDDNKFLGIYLRSSTPSKKGLLQANGVGIIDADYADNPDNDGAIGVLVLNFRHEACVIEKGERIAQGIFQTYDKTDDDNASGSRIGGFGSTGV